MSELDFKIVANNDVTIQFTVLDSDNSAVNIAGASIVWEARTVKGATADIIKSVGSGISITNGAAGIFTVTIDAADTVDMLAGEYIHEAVVTLSGLSVTLTEDDKGYGIMTLRDQYTAQA